MITKFLQHISHHINIVKHHFRDLTTGTKRSGKWPTVEHHYKTEHPTCAACGGSDSINIHHIYPFHLDPELELNPDNLITLCMGKSECHLKLGHLGNFKLYNPYIRENAAEALARPDQFEAIVKAASLHAKKN